MSHDNPTNFEDVGAFHRKFGLYNVQETVVPNSSRYLEEAPPELPSPTMAETDEDLMGFRIKFMHEELKEFEDGYGEQDIAQMADALIDLVYVALGTAHFLGLPWQQLWDDVQERNMAKVRAAKDASDSKRGSSFDVVKPEGWYPPDTAGILKTYGFDV